MTDPVTQEARVRGFNPADVGHPTVIWFHIETGSDAPKTSKAAVSYREISSEVRS